MDGKMKKVSLSLVPWIGWMDEWFYGSLIKSYQENRGFGHTLHWSRLPTSYWLLVLLLSMIDLELAWMDGWMPSIGMTAMAPGWE